MFHYNEKQCGWISGRPVSGEGDQAVLKCQAGGPIDRMLANIAVFYGSVIPKLSEEVPYPYPNCDRKSMNKLWLPAFAQ